MALYPEGLFQPERFYDSSQFTSEHNNVGTMGRKLTVQMMTLLFYMKRAKFSCQVALSSYLQQVKKTTGETVLTQLMKSS